MESLFIGLHWIAHRALWCYCVHFMGILQMITINNSATYVNAGHMNIWQWYLVSIVMLPSKITVSWIFGMFHSNKHSERKTNPSKMRAEARKIFKFIVIQSLCFLGRIFIENQHQQIIHIKTIYQGLNGVHQKWHQSDSLSYPNLHKHERPFNVKYCHIWKSLLAPVCYICFQSAQARKMYFALGTVHLHCSE